MVVSTKKRKIMTNSMDNSADISMINRRLEGMTSLKSLGAILGKDGTCSA